MRPRLRAPAKLNLELRVLGRRPDGSHEVRTLIQAISLADELIVEPADRASIEVTGFRVPVGESNLALRAAQRLGRPARIQLEKRIPPGAGLGGGSSDAAAVLRELGGDRGDLLEIASELGADVPFFLRGGRARASGRGEVLEPQPDQQLWFAIAWPGFQISTASVYQKWDEVGGEGRNELQRAAEAVEPRLAAFALRLGAEWTMTGSGSAFYRIAADAAEARQAVAGFDGWTAVAESEPRWS